MALQKKAKNILDGTCEKHKEVLRKMGIKSTIVLRLRKKQLKSLRHIRRKEGLENLTLKGLEDKKDRQKQ